MRPNAKQHSVVSAFANIRERGEPVDSLELVNEVVLDSVSRVAGSFFPAHKQRIGFLQLPDRTTTRVASALHAEGFEAIPESLLSHGLADVDNGCAGNPTTIEVVQRVLAKARSSDRVLLKDGVGAFNVGTQHDVDPVSLRHSARVQSD